MRSEFLEAATPPVVLGWQQPIVWCAVSAFVALSTGFVLGRYEAESKPDNYRASHVNRPADGFGLPPAEDLPQNKATASQD